MTKPSPTASSARSTSPIRRWRSARGNGICNPGHRRRRRADQAGGTGNLLIKGIPGLSLFKEYLHNEKATRESFDEPAISSPATASPCSTTDS